MRKIIFLLLLILIGSFNAVAQCDTTESICSRLLTNKFISDGQQYRALLVNNEVAEFSNTFYGGSLYRIVTGTGKSPGNIIYRVYDSERNLLFSSAPFGNPPVWDFKFNSTLNCTIEAQLATPQSGCAVMLIGFKN